METMKILIMDDSDEVWEKISESLKNDADGSIEPVVLMAKEDGMRMVRQMRDKKQRLALLRLTEEAQRDYEENCGGVPCSILDEADVVSDELEEEDICLVMMKVRAKSIKAALASRGQQKARPAPRSIDEIIRELFMRMGMQPQYRGYRYTREAILIVLDSESGASRVTKDIYPGVAKRCETTTSKVERCIRHAITKVWENGKIEEINDALGFPHYCRETKPANSHFIATMAEICRKQLQLG